MPLWDDPLDELIAGLEAKLPAASVPQWGPLPPRTEDIQEAFNPFLFLGPDQPVVLTPEQDARLDKVINQMRAAMGLPPYFPEET
jgi:hypothetical protein